MHAIAALDNFSALGRLGLSVWALVVLAGVFFFTSAISMVTGRASLITVPALIQAGVEPQVAIATNMAALTLMSIGATLPFFGQSKLDTRRSPWLIGLTLVGSALGALLLKWLPDSALSPFIAASMLVVVGVSLLLGDRGAQLNVEALSPVWSVVGYLATFFLAIYGGLFSGGYVTLLTATFVGCFGHTFVEAIATSKLVNIFSSLIATVIFIHLGLVNFGLGLLLGVAMFLGAFLGERIDAAPAQPLAAPHLCAHRRCPGPKSSAKTMIEINIPGFRHLQLTHLVLDYNGTLAIDGHLIAQVGEKLIELSHDLHIHVLTADTFGLAQTGLAGLPLDLTIAPPEDQAETKRTFVSNLGAEQVVAIGNGRNDGPMLKAAALGVALVQLEGGAVETLLSADIVSTGILDALDLLSHPKRLVATLRA